MNLDLSNKLMSKNIQLPAPKMEGEFMIELKERKSYRQFEEKEISL